MNAAILLCLTLMGGELNHPQQKIEGRLQDLGDNQLFLGPYLICVGLEDTDTLPVIRSWIEQGVDRVEATGVLARVHNTKMIIPFSFSSSAGRIPQESPQEKDLELPPKATEASSIAKGVFRMQGRLLIRYQKDSLEKTREICLKSGVTIRAESSVNQALFGIIQSPKKIEDVEKVIQSLSQHKEVLSIVPTPF